MKTHLTSLLATSFAAALALVPPARAADTILHNFTGTATDGSSPYGSLTLSGSKLYGMTNSGGSTTLGALFSMNTDGTGFGLLHSFASVPSDGQNPLGSLTLSGAKLYGMTNGGGSSFNGALFSMNTDGTGYSLLHNFAGGASDGAFPFGSLTLSGSKLYGMTYLGGSSGSGALFSMNTDGTGFGLLHSFANGATDGAYPSGSLTLSGTKLYGMTNGGGSNNTGTLFSINTSGTGFGLLHTFLGGASDGISPSGSLTLSGTKLYGMTNSGGSSDMGTVFSMNTNGSGFGLLHTFLGGASDGSATSGSLTLSGAKLYGMTNGGGSNNRGTLFGMNTDGSGFGLLQSFGGAPADGESPGYADVTLSGDGSTLYGMTYGGGTADAGVVFSHPTPEPTSAALLASSALGLLHCRRRQVTR